MLVEALMDGGIICGRKRRKSKEEREQKKENRRKSKKEREKKKELVHETIRSVNMQK